jgi:hypothetical protein
MLQKLEIVEMSTVKIKEISQYSTEGFRERHKKRIDALSRNCYFGFEILAAVTIESSILWDIMTSRPYNNKTEIFGIADFRNCKLSLTQLAASNLNP